VVTISLGVAGRGVNASIDGSNLLAEADKQLYKAKNSGRGRVCGALLQAE
jgi:PleD family two-component response regulator